MDYTRLTARCDKYIEARSARTGSGQGIICGIQTEFMIHYTSVFLSVTRVEDNETLTSFIGLLWSCPSPAD